MRIAVKNWKDFQHYKDRSPPWIKLHKGLLDNYEYQRLPIASRALAPMLWLLASESDDGSIDGDTEKIAFRLRTSEKEVIEALKPLIDGGFLIDASDSLACRYQAARPETEVEAYKPEAEERQSRERPARGTRLSAEWECPEDWIADAMAIRPHWDRQKAVAVSAAFRDYWVGVAGQKSRKTDWRATWRNWVRNERDDQRKNGGTYKTVGQERAETIAALTGRSPPANEPAQAQGSLIEGEARRVAG